MNITFLEQETEETQRRIGLKRVTLYKEATIETAFIGFAPSTVSDAGNPPFKLNFTPPIIVEMHEKDMWQDVDLIRGNSAIQRWLDDEDEDDWWV